MDWAGWVSKIYPLLLCRLKANPLSNMSVSLEIFSTTLEDRKFWLFVTMCVNRTLPSDCVAAVGTTKQFATE
jgi:hypothetical protein